MFRHLSCDENQMLYTSIPYVHVNRAGDPSQFFKIEEVEPKPVLQQENGDENTNEAPVTPVNNSDNTELPDGYTHVTSWHEDINMFRSMGLDVDNDNDPVLENILKQQPSPPTQSASSTTSTNSG